MIFARQLERLRQAAAVAMPGCPPGKVTVDVRDLRSLLYHFDRIDAELRAIHQAPESHPDDGIRFRKLFRHHKSTNGVFCIAELVGFDDSGNAEWAAVDGDLRSLLDRIQAEACDSQTADSEAQAGLCRNGEAQECPCNACHKEKLAANPPADRAGSLMALASRGIVLCPTCGNKRCPHANDHRNACTGSNEQGQVASHGDHSMLLESARANLERLIAAGRVDPAKFKRRLEELKIGKPPLHLPDDFILVQRNPDKAVCLDGSRFHGWLMCRHLDGLFVSERKLEPQELMQAEDQRHYGIMLDGRGSRWMTPD